MFSTRSADVIGEASTLPGWLEVFCFSGFKSETWHRALERTNDDGGRMLQPLLSLRKLSQWVLCEIVEDVPKDSALCEFDCRKRQCTQGEWATCERRLNFARGELMPAPAEFAAPGE
jgi:hypothetical protein